MPKRKHPTPFINLGIVAVFYESYDHTFQIFFEDGNFNIINPDGTWWVKIAD